jgi:hypothetical protein
MNGSKSLSRLEEERLEARGGEEERRRGREEERLIGLSRVPSSFTFFAVFL